MRPDRARRSSWARLAVGLLAGISWAATVTLFGGSVIAGRESLAREGWLLGGAGWMVGVLTIVLVARWLKRD